MRLSDFITTNLEPILHDWEAYATEIQAAQGMNSDELRDHARQMLKTIAKDLDTPQSGKIKRKNQRGTAREKGLQAMKKARLNGMLRHGRTLDSALKT